MVFFPELLYFFLAVNKIQVCIYLLVQSKFLLFYYRNNIPSKLLPQFRYNKKPPSCKRTKAVYTFAPPVTLYGHKSPIHVPLNGGNAVFPYFFPFQERDSGVIFCRNYLHRASTCPRLSEAFVLLPAYCLHHSLYILHVLFHYTVSKNHMSRVFPAFHGKYSLVTEIWYDIID